MFAWVFKPVNARMLSFILIIFKKEDEWAWGLGTEESRLIEETTRVPSLYPASAAGLSLLGRRGNGQQLKELRRRKTEKLSISMIKCGENDSHTQLVSGHRHWQKWLHPGGSVFIEDCIS